MRNLWIRFVNFLADGPFWQKRWWWVLVEEYGTEESLKLPNHHRFVSKKTNSEWRREAKFILLRSTGDRVCKPIYFKAAADLGRKLRKPLRTKLFAMRVTYDTDDTYVITIDCDGEVYVPEIVKGKDTNATILAYEEDMKDIVFERFNENVTFI